MSARVVGLQLKVPMSSLLSHDAWRLGLRASR